MRGERSRQSTEATLARWGSIAPLEVLSYGAGGKMVMLSDSADCISSPVYRRDHATRVLFAGLVAFGFLNAVLGPALPYIRAEERISYLAGSLHQVAFALGGGVAGLLAAATGQRSGRERIISLGLGAAGVTAIGLGYGDQLVLTAGAAFLVSLFGTSALVRIWAGLADIHGSRRSIALAEGEVLVSLGGIVAPVLVGGLAATALTWRCAFLIGAVGALATAVAIGSARVSGPAGGSGPPRQAPTRAGRLSPPSTLIVVFAIVAFEFALSFWLASYLNDSVGIHRGGAVLMVSGLYAANLAGRLAASRLARRESTQRLLAAALLLALAGLPILLLAGGAAVAAVGIATVGLGLGATFPLTSSLHVAASPHDADTAIGQVIALAAVGQIAGPTAVAVIAQYAGLRVGLTALPVLNLLAVGALARYASTRR